LESFRQQQVSIVFHAGDVTDAATLRLFAGVDVWLAQGIWTVTLNCAPVQELFGSGRMAKVHHLSVPAGRCLCLAMTVSPWTSHP
jgi:hypothetical protein